MRCPILAELPVPPPGKTGWPWTVESPRPLDIELAGSEWPLISIVTPSFNQGEFIEETIRSILLQGYPNAEYIIIDGGSTDGTVNTIRRYARWLTRWTSERDDGQSDALNKGFSVATGNIVAWVNSDDLLTPGALHHVALRFLREKGPAVVCGSAEVRTRDLSTVLWTFDSPPTTTFDIFSYPEGRQIGQPSVFMSRQLLDFPEPLRRDLDYIMDFDLWLRLSQKCQFLPITETLSWIRYHLDAKTYRQPYRVFEELELFIAKHDDLLSPIRKMKLIKACRREGARGYLVSALFQARSHLRKEAIRLVWEALRLDLKTLSSRTLYVVLAHACLPAGLRSRLLRNPFNVQN